MPRYVDGFVIPVPRKNLKSYFAIARRAGKVWKEHGALEYCEAVCDDANPDFGVPFPKLAATKPGETVIFSWIVYKSRAHRDRVNAKVMKDPRITRMMEGQKMPFDSNRMSYGGFKIGVDFP